MKKFAYVLAAALVLGTVLSGCAKEEEKPAYQVEEIIPGVNDTDTVKGPKEEPTPEPTPEEESHEGMVRSELTNEWIDESIKDQRPVAVMIDNEKAALPHFGVNDADIVYEIMNSTANNRITRLMVIYKDWKNIKQLGSVRSTRPTNFMLAAEWNAILIHDGGPFYNDAYYGKDYVNNLNGGFARFSNGKNLEYTEYVTYDDYTNEKKGKTYDGLGKRMEDSKYSPNYTDLYPGQHFAFAEEELDLSGVSGAEEAKNISLPFYHNESQLKYNEETKTYDYYEYGEPHKDAESGEVTTFKNVILQSVSHTRLDDNGYLIYNVIGSGTDGYYLTDGYAIPIVWSKGGEAALTVFTSTATGKDIELNTGKTYIALVPEDSWEKVTLN